jgi:FAD/FMN-containing dehydrogenase
MNEARLSAAVKEDLVRVVGPERVSEEAARLSAYAGDATLSPRAQPALVVYPSNKDEVKGIVHAARDALLPLTPVSSGAPHAKGLAAVPGGVIVDFSRMNRIVKIDATHRYAWIEPGVSFGDLIPALKREGLRISAPLLPRANKSVAASRLEREPTLIPKYQYDYVDPLLTLEVVYGTGEDFRTGSACGPGPLESLKADKVNPWGPGSIDYFRLVSGAQGTMGFITWVITKAEVLPEAEKLFFLPASGAGVIVDCMNELLLHRVGDEVLALNAPDLAAVLARTVEEVDGLRAALPAWTLIVRVAGYRRRPAERIAIQERALLAIAARHGLTPALDLPGSGGREAAFAAMLGGVWSGSASWRGRAKGASRDIFFLAPMSKVAHLVDLMRDIATEAGYPLDSIGAYLQAMVQGRGCHCEFNLAYDFCDARETAAAGALFLEASRRLMRAGAFFSRPYGVWADMVYSGYPDGVAALKTLKRIFDPNHILNPGKLCF